MTARKRSRLRPLHLGGLVVTEGRKRGAALDEAAAREAAELVPLHADRPPLWYLPPGEVVPRRTQHLGGQGLPKVRPGILDHDLVGAVGDDLKPLRAELLRQRGGRQGLALLLRLGVDAAQHLLPEHLALPEDRGQPLLRRPLLPRERLQGGARRADRGPVGLDEVEADQDLPMVDRPVVDLGDLDPLGEPQGQKVLDLQSLQGLDQAAPPLGGGAAPILIAQGRLPRLPLHPLSGDMVVGPRHAEPVHVVVEVLHHGHGHLEQVGERLTVHCFPPAGIPWCPWESDRHRPGG